MQQDMVRRLVPVSGWSFAEPLPVVNGIFSARDEIVLEEMDPSYYEMVK